MSELAKLIKELCPNGVEYKALIDICKISRGVRVTRNQLTDYDKYPVYQNSLTPLGFYEKNNCCSNTVFIISAGAAGEIGFCKIDFWAADDCLYFECPDNLKSRFLYYALLCKQDYLFSRVRKASVPRLSRTVVEQLKIPVPPLPVQAEIVRILDSFTELTTELTDKLTTELAARRKQYEYYRNEMLNLNNVPYKTLGELCRISAGGDVPKNNFSKTYNDKYQVPIYSNGIGDNALYGYTDIAKISERCVTIAARGTIGYCSLRKEPFYPIIRLICAIPKKEVSADYLKYAIETIKFQVPTTGIPQLTVPMVAKYTIPVPQLEEQKHIVSILDRFDKFCNDLTEGLPAEIAARQKQYEYYRDKLLTFKGV